MADDLEFAGPPKTPACKHGANFFSCPACQEAFAAGADWAADQIATMFENRPSMPFDEWVKMITTHPPDGGGDITLPKHAAMFIYGENNNLWIERAALSERVNALELQAKQDVTQLAAMCNEVVRLREALEWIANYGKNGAPLDGFVAHGLIGRAKQALSRQERIQAPPQENAVPENTC